MQWENKKALVCGMARSGKSAAELLNHLGAKVVIQDRKPLQELEDLSYLTNKGIKLYVGQNPDAIVADMDMVVVSPGIACDLPFFEIARAHHVPVIGEVELSYLLTPCPVAAITGTNGKTTTTALTGQMLKKVYPNTAIVGNIGVPYSEKVLSLTSKDYVCAEISSFQLETIDSFHPHISAVLNITPDHLNRHKTVQNYIAAKENIFKNQTKEDICVLNYEDAVCRQMAQKTKAEVFYFSSAHVLEKGIYLQDGNIMVKYNQTHEAVLPVKELSILGVHNYENAMAAIAIALCANVDLDSIRKTLREFKAVEHRIEFVETVDGVDYYNDSKGTNPDAAIRAVLAMQKPIILIAGGYDKGSDFDSLTKLFEGRVKELILLGATAEKIAASARKFGFTQIVKAASLEEAVETGHRDAKKGDCVLLSPACASWDMFKSYEQRGDQFKEKVRGYVK